MILIDAVPNGRTQIGRLGENDHRGIRFPSAATLAMYPDASVTVLHQRPGDPAAYPVNPANIQIQDGRVIWCITSSDLTAEGTGTAELIYTKGEVVAKTEYYRTQILPALDGSGTPPEPWESWQESLVQTVQGAYDAAEDAKKWATGKDKDGHDVPSTDEHYENNAHYGAEQSKLWAIEKDLSGNDAENNAPQKNNSAKHWAEQASASATSAGNAKTDAEAAARSIVISSFDNLSAMRQSESLAVGDVVETKGYYSAGDGGGAKYRIRAKTSSDTDNAATKIVIGNLTAILIPENGRVNAQVFGIKSYSSNSLTGIDDTALLNKAISYSAANRVIIFFPKGKYYFTEVNLKQKNGAMLEGENENINTETSDQLTFFVAIGTPTNDAKAFIVTNAISTKSSTNYAQMTQTKDISVRNIYIWINVNNRATRDYGIFAGYTTHAVFENLRIRNFSQGVYLNNTWNTIIRHIYVTHYTTIGIEFENTTNMLNCENLYCNTEYQADGAFRIYGSHSVQIDGMTCEGGGAHAMIILDMYPSNINGFVANNLHCENSPTLIQLNDASTYASFKGLSTGAITIRGGIWAVPYSSSIRLIEVGNDPFYSLKELAFENFRIQVKNIGNLNSIDSNILKLSNVDCLKEDVLWYQVDATTILKEKFLLRMHGDMKYRYGISEAFANGYQRIYNGRSNQYSVECETEAASQNLGLFPLLDYENQTLHTCGIDAYVIYTNNGTTYYGQYKIEVNSNGMLTQTHIDGENSIVFGLSNGFLTITASNPVHATFEVRDFDYFN